jgi:hypothetical protein
VDPSDVYELTGLNDDPQNSQSSTTTTGGGGLRAFTSRSIDPRAHHTYTFCSGLAEPTLLVTVGNQARLTFQSRGEPDNHFWLSWTTLGAFLAIFFD